VTEVKIPNYLGKSGKKKIKLHADAVGQGFAILGKRGKGKSILASDMMEIFESRSQKFVVLDSPDAHWGIRFKADADGKPTGPSGLEVLLVGGEHGDVPLDPRGGKDLANTIVDGDISTVISMKQLGFAERQRFCADFGEELFRINKTPRHIFFEECQNYLPQQLKFEEQKRVLYAMEKIVEEGRGGGLGFTLISQRPALINKNVLEQTDNMFALGMIGPNDLEQMKNWFKHHIRDKEKLEHFVDDLAKMKQGECWFLSPEWLSEIVKFNVRYRVTYHAGRTPKVGERPVNVAKFSVGQAVERLRKLFAEKKVERAAEVQDLTEAKKEIRRLESELKIKAKVESSWDVVPAKPAKVKVTQIQIRKALMNEVKPFMEHAHAMREIAIQARAFLTGAKIRIEQIGVEDWARWIDAELPAMPKLTVDLKEVKLNLQNQKQDYMALPETISRSQQKRVAVQKGEHPDLPPNWGKMIPRTQAPVEGNYQVESNGDKKLGSGARRLLAAVAGWPDGMKEGQWRAHAGLKKSGTFDTYKSKLKSSGLIEFRNGLVFATQAGLDLIGSAAQQTPRTTDEVLNIWRPKLGPGPWRIMELLLNNPGEYAPSHLKQAAGFAERSGTFDTYMSRLKTARLIKSENKLVSLDRETLLL
jgi:uncharacterized protein